MLGHEDNTLSLMKLLKIQSKEDIQEKKEKLITVNGQNPLIEETEEGKGETKDKKTKQIKY